MKIKGPDTSSSDYKYGIFARIKNTGSGSRGWTDSQIKMWCDMNDVYYDESDTREDLIQRIKDAGHK